MEPKIIVHGGAWTIPPERRADHVAGCHAAVAAVWPALQAGLSALEAARLAVNVLEEDPTFDAGRGAVLNADGEIELDAAIMDGSTLDFGAVAAVRHFLNPVDIARKVLDSEYCFLVAEGAERFAVAHGMTPVTQAELMVERELLLYDALRQRKGYSTHDAFRPVPKGTVGAVVLDLHGNIAAATSTGGTPFKHAGRVGDSPLCGAGTYADNLTGGASATGFGEGIIRTLMTRTACDLLREYGPPAAARRAIANLHDRVGGHAGLIMLDRHGRYGLYCNTDHVAHAYVDADGVIHASVDLPEWATGLAGD